MEESKLTGESQFATIEAEGEGESELVKIDTTDSKLKLRKNFAPTSTIGRIVETEQKFNDILADLKDVGLLSSSSEGCE